MDKCLRRDEARVPSQEYKLKIMSLSTFEARCLGRLVPDVTDWLKAHNAGGSPEIERLSGMNSVLQALSAFRQSRDFAQGVEWLMSYGLGDEMAVLLYGALAVVPIFLLWLYLSWCLVLLGGLVAAEWPRHW